MHEIVDGIFTWSWRSPAHGYDFNGWLVRHPAGNLCIDPVEPSADDLAWIVREGAARILLTNRNHTRRAALVRERTGARIAIHPGDADHARAQGTPVDDDLAAGARIGPFEVVGVPGKSPGEVAFWDAARRLLIVGDALIGNPPGALSFLPDRVVDDPPLLRASVRELAALDVDVLLPGDGVAILGGAGTVLRGM